MYSVMEPGLATLPRVPLQPFRHRPSMSVSRGLARASMMTIRRSRCTGRSSTSCGFMAGQKKHELLGGTGRPAAFLRDHLGLGRETLKERRRQCENLLAFLAAQGEADLRTVRAEVIQRFIVWR